MTIEIIQLGESNMDILNNYDEDIFDEKIDSRRLAAMLKEQNNILLVAVNESVVIGQVLAVIHRHPINQRSYILTTSGFLKSFSVAGLQLACFNNCILSVWKEGVKKFG